MILEPCQTPTDLLRREMSKAQTYHEWRALATELDRLLGNDKWKKNPKAKDYDHRLIASRLGHLRALEAEDDLPARMFFLRAGWRPLSRHYRTNTEM